jgi:hypothetical protein
MTPKMQRRQRWTLVAIGIVAFAVAFPIGYYLNTRASRPVAALFQITANAGIEELSLFQYKEAGTPYRREALLGLLNFLQTTEGLKRANHKSLNLTIAYTYARLAVVEDVAGNLNQSHDYFLKAQERFKTAGLKDYSEAHLRGLIAKADKTATQ